MTTTETSRAQAGMSGAQVEMSGLRSTAAGAGGFALVRDLVLLLARIGLGVIMVYHAKLEYDFGGSVSGVIAMFDEAGIPLAVVAGPLNLFGELIGGVAVILGAAVRLVGVAMAVNMLGAWVFVHNSGLMAADHNGPEFVITLGLLSLVLAATGSGRIGLDHLIEPRLRRRFAPNRKA